MHSLNKPITPYVHTSTHTIFITDNMYILFLKLQYHTFIVSGIVQTLLLYDKTSRLNEANASLDRHYSTLQPQHS